MTENRSSAADDRHSVMEGLSSLVARASAPAPLDDVDRELLAVLAEDPRVSQRQLAKQIGMSAPAIGERIARLERLGVIRGYTVDIDWSAVGLPMLVYIPMTTGSGSDVKALLEEVRRIPELEELVVVTGGYDFIARFRLRDHAHLQEILLDRLYRIPGLQRFETILTLGEIPSGIDLARVLEHGPDR